VSRNRRVAAAGVVAAIALVASCATADRTPERVVEQGLPTRSLTGQPGGEPASAAGVYAHTGVGDFVAATRHVPYRLYVPESAGHGVSVVDPVTLRVIAYYRTGLDPQHVVPSYDLKTLWSTNDLANTMTPFDPRTGRPKGKAVAVDDPYNLYFLPGGKEAVVIQEARERLAFYDAQTMAPHSVLPVECPGVDHADFTADERFMVASCEFGHRLLRMDVRRKQVTGYLDLPGSAPQDVRLSPDGTIFFVADKKLGGVHLIDAAAFTKTGFLKTGKDAHGIYPSRDGRRMFVSNRGNGTISVLDPAARRVLTTWRLPGGGSPDMGGLSPDGRSLWLSGRYDATIYQISTTDGRLLAKVRVPRKPHGMCVWPQPGRYSLGHTGNMR
jgi:DNA-binding beta-propeller fold protein YncE